MVADNDHQPFLNLWRVAAATNEGIFKSEGSLLLFGLEIGYAHLLGALSDAVYVAKVRSLS